MKTVSFLFAALIFPVALTLHAQEAIPYYSLSPVAGYSYNGAGFAFVPTVPVEITALGFNSISNSPSQVNLLDNQGNLLSTAQVTTSNPFYNQTYYQSITPILLAANTTNYIEAGAVANGLWVGNVAGAVGGSFSVNPVIQYLYGANDFVAGLPTTLDGANFFEDVNFQFTVVPEPSAVNLFAVTLLGLFALCGRSLVGKARR